ncbi:MAG: hypothetical protein V7776_01225 [Halopseudomonas aestusnigri]
MMDQLYANQATPSNPANAIAVSAISTNIPAKGTPPTHTNSFKEQLSSPKAIQTASLESPVSIQKTSDTETAENNGQEFGFLDFLDIINPLQHIPVVSSIYREITGDELKPTARVFGGMLFGGPSGFVSAIANSIVEETTGKDIGANILEAFLGPDETQDSVQIAESDAGNKLVTASVAKDTAAPEIIDIFAQLSPVPPPAPILINSATPPLGTQNIVFDAKSTPPVNTPNVPLQGKAALAAIYNDLGRIKTNTSQDLASQSLQVAEASTLTNTLKNQNTRINQNTLANNRNGNPGKWFPLSGNNVIIAQTSTQTSTLASAPPPKSALHISDSEPKDPAPEVASTNQSEFAKNLLTGLEKYRELKKP